MEKVIFVALAKDDDSECDTSGIIGRTTELLDPIRYPDVSVQLEDREATDEWRWRGPLPPLRVVAMLAVWTECADDVGDVERIAREVSTRCAGFVVTEAVPRWHAPRSPRGVVRQSGVTLTSLLSRARALTRDQFLQHWYDVHMPMSLRVHPQWTYVRNVVSRVLTAGAPDVDAICEEGFADVGDVLDASRFFGADETETDWLRSRAAIGDDVPKFLDPSCTTTSIMRDHHVRDFRALLPREET